MKPLLERKRRARINRCLDELKEYLLSTSQADGENVNKLEKADILEFIVQHLHKLHRRNQSVRRNNDRFCAGFTHCASEVSRCLATAPEVDVNLGRKLMSHLNYRLQEMENSAPLFVRVNENCAPASVSSPPRIFAEDSSYNMPLTPASSNSSRGSSPCLSVKTQYYSDAEYSPAVMDMSMKYSHQPVWRPW